MCRLPLRLEKCPVIETNLEIRFLTNMPGDAVFGIIYQALQSNFEGYTPQIQSISQIPIELRDTDPNIRYQPTHLMIKDNLSIGIGPKSIIFSNRAPYKGWNTFKNFVLLALSSIEKINIVKEIEKIGLRYINIIEKPLADATNLVISLCGETKDKNDVSTLRLEKKINTDSLLVLQLNDNVLVSINSSAPKKLSMIDIDAITNHRFDSSVLKQNKISNILDELHNIEKSYFYKLLNEDFKNGLYPIYEEE